MREQSIRFNSLVAEYNSLNLPGVIGSGTRV